jgi:N6-L-threonylcarbamoyladenine synthase
MIILAIETSCDDTALALLETRGQGLDFEYRVIASIVHSQAALHSPYGGVFPALAKREHSKNLPLILPRILSELSIEKASIISTEHITLCLEKFGDKNTDLVQAMNSPEFRNAISVLPPIDLIAVTQGPGLEPALWTGISFATILGQIWNIPVVPVNHMEGHIVGSLLAQNHTSKEWQKLHELPLPAIALLISGGHTELVHIEPTQSSSESLNSKPSEKSGYLSYKIIGHTVDDAVGEAFDKTARLLGLSYPGGPQISLYANMAREAGLVSAIKLPRPMLHSKDLNFSFSGLKTAVLYAVQHAQKTEMCTDDFKKGLAREFEDAVTETLMSKLKKAIEKIGAQSIIIGGGVSANQTLRNEFESCAKEYDIPLFLPSQHVSGDNALMIALAAALYPKTTTHINAQGTQKLGRENLSN